ncbi:MAG: manganese efflux pump MntP family protein [Firmicutes bacterium]|nr:manganese efflux pump MntP family protein [Bacillota bacterium]
MVVVFFLAVSLAMDALAVSFCNGLRQKRFAARWCVASCVFFGLMQGGMPVLGYFLGELILPYIESFQTWVAMGILVVLGGKMLREGIKEILQDKKNKRAMDAVCAKCEDGDEVCRAKREQCERFKTDVVVMEIVSKNEGRGGWSVGRVLAQGVATSIDAFAVGLAVATLGVSVWVVGGVIAVVTAVLCFGGVVLGYKSGKIFAGKEGWAVVLGGVVMIGFGISFLFR